MNRIRRKGLIISAVIRSDIQNLKKLLAIFQRQQKQDQRTVERWAQLLVIAGGHVCR